MTAKSKTAKRRSAIIAELSRLSRDGWANARPCDYEPLERELRGFSCTPGSIATEHAAQLLELYAAAGAGVAP